MIGKRIAHFEVVEKLGEGGMGVVYKATDTHLDRPVALKVLPPEAVANPDRRRRFVQEAKAASALNHPNIIHIYDIDEAEGQLFIAMEYVEGRTLDQLIMRKGLPFAEALRYAAEMAGALTTAHAAGIVHRDLKPSNIMVSAQQTVKVLDFGLAKLLEGPASTGESEPTKTLAAGAVRTAEGTIVGTAAYMSPEQAEGKPLDERSDIFSLGAVLYEMTTGRRAFPGDSAISVLSAVLRDEPTPLSEIRKDAPGELERIIARCLRKDPARRFQHMADLRVALDEIKEERESGERVAAAAPRPTPRHWLGVLAALLVLIALAAGAWKLGWLSNRAAPSGSLVATQLTTAPGLSMGASLSPDGGSIAFSSNRSGRFEIYVRPANGRGSERQVTSDGQQNIEPSWAPDGKSVAYHCAARRGIWVVPIDAHGAPGNPRQLTPFGSRPVWSPDGSRVAFRSAEPNDLAWFDLAGTGESVIFVVGADGSNLRQVTVTQNPAGRHADPSWSPDGKRLVFASMGPMGARASRNTLWTVEVATGELKQIPTGDLMSQFSPVIAPDGRTVYFSALALDGFAIYSVPLAGNAPPVALHRTGREMAATISLSRDARRLFYTRIIHLSQIWHTGASAGEAKALYQDDVVRAKIPRYSPDGKRLVYAVQSQNTSQDLWIMNADGSGATAIVSEPGIANGPGWSADSGSIWFTFYSPSRFQVRRIQVADRTQQVLLESKEVLTRLSLSPDQRELTYDSGRPLNVWIRPLAGAAPRQITFDREGAGFPTPSWDGEWVVYQLYRGESTQIAVMDRTGARQQVLIAEPGPHYAHSFASDNRRIAYTACPDGVWNVFWIDRITREIRQVTHYTAYGSVVRSPAWRPGTEEMAFEFTEVKGNVYALELPRAM